MMYMATLICFLFILVFLQPTPVDTEKEMVSVTSAVV